MPYDRLALELRGALDRLAAEGRRHGEETVIAGVLPAADGRGPRVLVAGAGEAPFLRMNANSYLGLSRDPAVIAAEEDAVRRFGTGPGAVRFIGGTYAPHVALERRLAAFHGREAAIAFGSAYAAVLGVLPPLVSDATAVVSDALNHNSIITAIRLARPGARFVYPHLDLNALEARLVEAASSCRRAIVVTDGVFSMRGDHAPLDAIAAIARRHDAAFAENVILIVDDSHGVGALGATGRGTEEVSGGRADILVGTLGKAFGVNGGYVAASATVIDYLRETAPQYVYSNPIAPGEAAAARAAIDLVDGAAGRALLARLGALTARFRAGLVRLGFETLPGAHPIVPLLVRDSARTASLVAHLRRHRVLATGLAYPVVPRGEEEIRFQISADHTEGDIDEVLDALARFSTSGT